MSALFGVVRREVVTLSGTMTAWVVLAAVAAIAVAVTQQSVLIDGQVLDLRPAMAAVMWSMALLAPALGIRATVQERRSGLWEVLLTTPASARLLTMGRFIGALGVAAAITTIACASCGLLASTVSSPDWGLIASSILGIALMCAALLAWTLAIGSIAPSAEAAYALTLALCVGWVLVAAAVSTAAEPWLADAGFALSPLHRMDEFLLGLVDASSVAYFVAAAGAGLGTAAGLGATEVTRSAASSTMARWTMPVLHALAWCAIGGASFAIVRSPLVRWRSDWTHAGLYEISTPSREIVGTLGGAWRITLVAPSDTDADVRLQVGQVLDSFAREASAAGRSVTVAQFDPGSAADAVAYGAWLEALDARFTRDQVAYDDALERAADELDAFERFVAAVRPALRDAIAGVDRDGNDRASLDQLRAMFDQLSDQFPAFRERLDRLRTANEARPFPDRAGAVRAYEDLFRAWSQQLVGVSRDLVTRSVGADVPPALRAFVASHARAMDTLGQSLRLAQDRLALLPPDEPGRLADAISRGSAAIVEGPRGVAVIPGWHLFPAANADAAPAADRRFRGEEAIIAAIRSLTTNDRLVVVMVHAEPRSLLKSTTNGADLAAVADALRLARIEVREWAVAGGAQPPLPEGARRAYIVVPPTERVTGEPTKRERELIAATRRLIETGEPVLLSIGPSVRALAGQDDPWAGLASALGASAQTAGIVVDDVPIGEGRREPRSDQVFDGILGDSPLASALRGLRVRLPSVVPMEPSAGAEALARVDPRVGRRIDREWRRVGRRRADESLASPVAAIVAHEPLPGRRSLVVACPDWLLSAVAARSVPGAGGRSALTDPGNVALATQGALWLAGMDALLASSPSDQAVARVHGGAGVWWVAITPLSALTIGAAIVRRRSRG